MDSPPQLSSASIPSSTWSPSISVSFAGNNLNACDLLLDEAECWWTDIELDKSQSAPGNFQMGFESINSASGTLLPSPAGGTFVFQGNACTDVVDGDGFVGNEEDSCDAGDASVGVDPQPAPTPSLQVTSNARPVAQGTCDNLALSEVLYISNSNPPTMPPVSAQIIMSDGSRPQGSVVWGLQGTFTQYVGGTATNPQAMAPPPTWGIGTQPPVAATDPWVVPWAQMTTLAGGNATINWTYNGVQQSFTFCILGTNPSESTVQSVLSSSPYWFANDIAVHETDQSQFCDGTTRTSGAPYCAAFGDFAIGFPIWGRPQGYGVMQVDPPFSLDTIWNWSKNLSDDNTHLQNLAGSMYSMSGGSAYPFWQRQVYQWYLENYNQISQTPPQPALPLPEDVDTGPYSTPNCAFIGSVSTPNPTGLYSTPFTNITNTYWYGDAILMKQNAGTTNKCTLSTANYVAWKQGTLTQPGSWVFNKPTLDSADIVYEFCTCTTFAACQRIAPACN